MARISFPKFKAHIGLLSDVGGVLGFLGTIKALFFSDWATLWAFTLQLNWVVGMIAFCVLLGWLVVILFFLDSVRSASDWLQWNGMDWKVLGIKTVEPDIRWFGFIIAGVVVLALWLVFGPAMALAAKWKPEWGTEKREEFGNEIFWGLYLMATAVAGVYFALTVKPDAVGRITSMGWLIRLLGWLILPLLAALMGILLVKLWKLLFSKVFTTEETDK